MLTMAAFPTIALVSTAGRTLINIARDNLIRLEKNSLVRGADGASAENTLLFLFVFTIIDCLRCNRPAPARVLLNEDPKCCLLDITQSQTFYLNTLTLFYAINTHLPQQTSNLVIGSINLTVLGIDCGWMFHDPQVQAKFDAYIQRLKALRQAPGWDTRTVYFLPYPLLNGAITIRIKDNANLTRINEVSLGFRVCNWQEDRFVQGLLIAIGEDTYAKRFPDGLKALRSVSLRKRVKASVEIFLWQSHMWQNGPLYNPGVPITSREAWMPLAKVFDSLTIHPMGGAPLHFR